jgi:amino acid permease
MPKNFPFGSLETISLIMLLLISNAWILLLVPRNWQKLGAFPQSFWLTMIFLMVWWVSVFAATGWLLANASEKAPSFDLQTGVFATNRTEIGGIHVIGRIN